MKEIHNNIIFLSFIFLILLLTNCKSKKITENNDYLINKAENQKAILVLFPCFPCDKINTKTEAKFLENIEKEGITTILLDYNQKLFLKENEQKYLSLKLNSIFDDNEISKQNVFIGGFSSGGNITILLSNYLLKTNNEIQPKGIFVVDSPLDLEELYKNAENDIKKNISIEAVEEAKFITTLFGKEIGNTMRNIENYKKYSPYLISNNSIQNIEFLKNIKTRFYIEPDLGWQSENRNRKYEDLNAFKLEKTYNSLKQLGAKKTEFIKTENRGYRANGQKHPHSWNIVEKENLVDWILK